MLFASWAPVAARAELANAGGGGDRGGELVAAIREEQQRNGPYSLDLLEPLNALMLWHEENDDAVLADALIEQALLVVRANFGLYSLEQAPLLRRRIRHEEARGNFALAWELERDLLELAARNPADLRAVAVLRETGDRRLDVLERYLRGEFPPQLVLGCYYNPMHLAAGSCTSGSQRRAVRAILADAQRQYRGASEVLVRNSQYGSGELRELEAAIVVAGYRAGSYVAGRQSLERMLHHASRGGESPARLLDIAAELGDWHLMFGESARALRQYEASVRDAEAAGVGEADIAAVFAPEVPVVLPTFLGNPLASRRAHESQAYIDVAFEISRFGRSRRIRVLESSTYSSVAQRERLEQIVAERRFRPQLRDGRFVDADVVLRYYLLE